MLATKMCLSAASRAPVALSRNDVIRIFRGCPSGSHVISFVEVRRGVETTGGTEVLISRRSQFYSYSFIGPVQKGGYFRGLGAIKSKRGEQKNSALDISILKLPGLLQSTCLYVHENDPHAKPDFIMVTDLSDLMTRPFGRSPPSRHGLTC